MIWTLVHVKKMSLLIKIIRKNIKAVKDLYIDSVDELPPNAAKPRGQTI